MIVSEGGAIERGRTVTIGFWQNKNGQALIKSLNGGENSTVLATWLAETLSNLYGNGILADMDGDGDVDNADIAATFAQLFKRNAKTSPGGPPKLDAQVMAVALATFVTKESLVGMRYDAAQGDVFRDASGAPLVDASLIARVESYGFDCTAGGVGSTWFDVGASGAAFGVADGTQRQIIDLLLATDLLSRNGLLYDDDDEGEDGHGELDECELLLRTLANDVYSRINERGL